MILQHSMSNATIQNCLVSCAWLMKKSLNLEYKNQLLDNLTWTRDVMS